jgi:tagaturonate epimerase
MEHQNLKLSKYSVGTGDRFSDQAKAQLEGCVQAFNDGVEVIPVRNKSNREHTIIGSEPSSTRQAADAAVKALDWKLPYLCDADHITLQTVDRFLDSCDFYTIDVADFIGRTAPAEDVDDFVKRHPELQGSVHLEGGCGVFEITDESLRQTAQKFLTAEKQAGAVYRKIENTKGAGDFIPEVSMDETDRAQSPIDLLIILAAIADEGIPTQTIAPKFSGRFNKGVDYVGDAAQFEDEMALDVAAIANAIRQYGLPENLNSACTPAATSSRSTPLFTARSSGSMRAFTSRPPEQRGWKS